MKKTISLIISVLILGIFLVGCKDNTKYYTVTFNSNGGSSIPSQSVEEGGKVTRPSDPTKEDYDFISWYSDNALTDEWDFSSDVVTTDTTLYAKWEAKEEPVYEGYMVTVVDDLNNPVPGIIVQWCNAQMCYGGTIRTDENGTVKNAELADDTYNVHLLNGVPEGYVYNPNVQTTPDNKQITIELLKVTSPSGEGTKENPYVAGVGAYLNQYESTSDEYYYTFTPTESGTYVIESHVMVLQNREPIDPTLIVYADESFSASTTTDHQSIAGGGKGDNFKHEIEVSEEEVGKTIYFSVLPSKAPTANQKFPNEFYFDIVKQ